VKIFQRATGVTQTVSALVTNTTHGFVYRWAVSYGGTTTEQTYTVLAAATATTVGTAIAALIDALPGVGAVASVGTITITPTTLGDRFMFDTYGAEFTVKDNSTDAGIATALSAGQALDPDFYGVQTDGYSEAEINAAAAWCEANGKLYLALTCDSDVLAGGSTDIASDFKLAGYNRCGVLVTRKQSQQMATALVARQLATEPGSSSWDNKALSGTADNFTTTEQTNATTKRACMYLSIAGVNVSYNIQAGSGRFFDTTRDIDWFDANHAADIFNALVNTEKVPYNNTGKSLVEAVSRRRGSLAESKGVFNAGTFAVTMPKDGQDDPTDKANGLLRFSWSAEKQIGMRKVVANGTVTL
jgi:hypothetical protein